MVHTSKTSITAKVGTVLKNTIIGFKKADAPLKDTDKAANNAAAANETANAANVRNAVMQKAIQKPLSAKQRKKLLTVAEKDGII